MYRQFSIGVGSFHVRADSSSQFAKCSLSTSKEGKRTVGKIQGHFLIVKKHMAFVFYGCTIKRMR